MPKRFQQLEDLFTITCKKCGSTDVDLSINECQECGNNIEARCRNCKQEYKYHDFKEIEVTY
jgi:ribosomal protein L37E